LNFDNKKVIPTKVSNILDEIEINKDDKSFKERIDFIKTFNEENNAQEDKFYLQKYFSKFRSRYNGKITIHGDRPANYKLDAKLMAILMYLKTFIRIIKRNFQLIWKEDY